MAILDVNSAVPNKDKMMKMGKNGDKKVYLVAQELKLARVLAGNDPKARDRALKGLKAWFTKRTQSMPFTEDDFQRIWKGLFYSMWMSDKPLIQEECAENISKLVHFPALDTSLLFFKAGLTILVNEWFGIDQLRLDKFLMLVRRLLRQILFAIKNKSFNLKNIEKFNDVLTETILSPHAQPPMGLFMHFIEIFMEELAKVSEGKIDSNLVVEFVKPFIQKMIALNDGRLIENIRKNIFTYLIRQSNLGLEYQEKYEAWKLQGFPGSIHSMQKVKLDDEERMVSDEEEDETNSSQKDKPLDPRAGRVDVELPQLKFNATMIAKALQDCKFDKQSTTKSRKAIDVIARQFSKLANGVYPLGTKKLKIKDLDTKIDIRKEAKKLIKFEQKLMPKTKKRKLNDENAETLSKRSKYEEKTNGDSDKDDVKNGYVDDVRVYKDNGINKKRKKQTVNDRKITIDNNDIDLKVNKKELKQNGDDVCDKMHRLVANTQNVNKTKKNKMKNKVQEEKQTVVDNVDEPIVKKKSNIDDIECIFERNSGTWVVFDVSRSKKNEKPSAIPGGTEQSVLIASTEKPSKRSHQQEFESLNNTKVNPSIPEKLPKISPKKSLNKKPHKSIPTSSTPNSSPEKPDSLGQNGTPKSGISPEQLFESPPGLKKDFFPKAAWEEPLQEGNKAEEAVHMILNNAIKKIKGKNRHSLDPRLLMDPFSKTGTPKKVKINTKMNRSQEIHEHHMQVLRSPAIPYDAKKQPLKPLLKKKVNTTPINPFYSKKKNLW